MPAALLLSADLMFSSRVAAAAQTLGVPLALVPQPADLPQKLGPDCRLVLVDLAAPGLDLAAAVASVRAAAPAARLVAYSAHVNEEALAAASQAGCEVLTRGQFHKQFAELLRDTAG
jgi:DNA-binding NarL/FixJ family response regulator